MISKFSGNKMHNLIELNEINNTYERYSENIFENAIEFQEERIELYELLKDERGLQARKILESKHHYL